MTLSTQDAVREAYESLEAQSSDGDAAPVAEAPPATTDSSGAVDLPAGSDNASNTQRATGESASAAGPGRVRGPDGKFTKTANTAEAKTPATVAPKPAITTETPSPIKQADGANPTPAPQTGETSVALKPPQSWKPQAREAWTKLPADVQAEIHRREKEYTGSLSESAEAKKGWQQYRETVGPYENHIRATGGDPLRAVGNMLQAGYILETGRPEQKHTLLSHMFRASLGHDSAESKAEAIAAMYEAAGISVDHLVAAMERRGQGQSQSAQPQSVDPRAIAAQVRQEVEQDWMRHQQEQARQRAMQEVAKLETELEFFNDVRPAMEAMLRSGAAKDYKAAYERATWADPDIRAILMQRQQAEQAGQAQQGAHRARVAASSVKTQPSGAASSKNGPLNTRDAVAAAWDTLASR